MSVRLEQFLSENKFLLGLVCGLALLAPLAYGVVNHFSTVRTTEHNNQIYQFRNDVFAKYEEKKLSSVEFLSELRQLKGQMEGHRGLYPLLLHFADELLGQEAWKEAEEVLLWGNEKFSQGHLLGDFFRLRLATLYEETNRPEQAIETLLQLTDNEDTPLLLDKLYLDMGRIYLALGNKEKSRAGLDYVLEHSKESEWIRLAKLMKEELDSP